MTPPTTSATVGARDTTVGVRDATVGDTPSRRTRLGRGGGALGVLAVIIVCALVAWLRLPPVARDTLWAEDGRVFVQQRVADGPFSTWFVPYDGYLHLVPRLLADAAWSWSPVDHLATVVTALACLVAGLVAAGVWVCSRGLVASRVVRLALAAVTVLVPLAPLEVSGNLANVHWYLLWLTPFLLLHRARSTTSTVVASLGALLIGLTEIQAVVLVPFVVAAFVVRPRSAHPRRDLAPVVVLVAALVVQLLVAALTARADAPGPASTIPQVVLGYLTSVVLGTWVPSAVRLGGLLDRGGWAVALIATAPFVLAAVVVVRAVRHSVPGTARLVGRVAPAHDPVAVDRLALAAVAGLASVAVWSVDVVVNHGPDTRFWFDDPGRVAELGLTRYAVVPSLFLLVVLLCAVDAAWRSPSRRSRAAAVLGLVLVVALVAVWFDGSGSSRGAGPGWQGSLDRAEEACDDGAAVADVAGAPVGWGVLLPCDVVDEDR